MRPRRFGYQHALCTYPLTGHLMIASKVPALSHWVPLLNFSFPSAPHRLLSSSSCACVLIVPSAKRSPGGVVGDTYLLPWIRSLEIRDAPVGRHWRLMARCILQSLQACLPTALCHDHTKYITTPRLDRNIFILILVSSVHLLSPINF